MVKITYQLKVSIGNLWIPISCFTYEPTEDSIQKAIDLYLEQHPYKKDNELKFRLFRVIEDTVSLKTYWRNKND